jgi:hypothetical protein
VSAKRHAVSETVTCPLCGHARAVEPKRSPLAEEFLLAQHGKTPHWANTPSWSVSLAQHGLLVWACDACISHGRAWRAKPWLQQFCCDTPRFAYFNITKTCRTCGNRFEFPRSEQRQWYEEFKLPPRAEPVECRACRAAKRAAKAAQAELATKLKALDSRDPQQLCELASLYVAIGTPRRAAECLRRAKNLVDDPAKVADLLDRIAELEHPSRPGRHTVSS